MDIATARDIVIIILFSLLIVVMITDTIIAIILYRRLSRNVKTLKEQFSRPVRSVEKTIACIIGTAKGLAKSLGIYSESTNRGN